VHSSGRAYKAELSAFLQGELPETFFQLLVESLKVEALIGLRDALEPDNLVPVPGHASSNPAEASTQHDSASKADATEDTGVKEDDSAGNDHVHIPGVHIRYRCLLSRYLSIVLQQPSLTLREMCAISP